MNVSELIAILSTYPADTRVIVDTELGFDDACAVAQPIAADHYRRTGLCTPDSWGGPHAQPCEFDGIEATETAVLVTRAP